MTKRRLRAGLRDMEGAATDTVFLRHSAGGGILWEQCATPAEARSGRYKTGRRSGFDQAAFKAVLEGFGGVLARSNAAEVAAAIGCSERTAWDWWKRLNIKEL